MNLSDYINLTITEIAAGSKKADTALKQMGNGGVLTETTSTIEGIPHAAEMVNGKPSYKPIVNVQFRVNVQMQESSEINGGLKGSIQVLSAGTETSTGSIETHSEELTFSIPIVLPNL